MVLIGLGEAYVQLRQADSAREVLQQAVALARERGDHHTAGIALRHLIHLDRGEVQAPSLPAQEFFRLYTAALKTQDQSLRTQLVKDNLTHVSPVVRFLLTSGLRATLAGQTNEATNSFALAERMAADYQEILSHATLAQRVTLYQRWSNEEKHRAIRGDASSHEGYQAYSTGDYREAQYRWEAALALYRDLGDRWEEGVILGNLGALYRSMGQSSQALETLQQALTVTREIGDREPEGVALVNLGEIYRSLGQYTQALEALQQALVIKREMGEREGEAIALTTLGAVYENIGQDTTGLVFTEQALALARELGDRRVEGVTLINLGNIERRLGRYIQGLEIQQEALTLLRDIGERWEEQQALVRIGEAYNTLGQSTKALEALQQALDLAKTLNNREAEGETLNVLGEVYNDLGQYAKALELHQQALAIQSELGNRKELGAILNDLGVVYGHLGQYAKALDLHQQVLTMRRTIGERRGEIDSLVNLGDVHLALGKYAESVSLAEQALALAQELDDRPRKRLALTSLGQVYRELGQYEKARALIERALVLARELGNRRDELAALNEAGLIYRHLGQYTKALEIRLYTLEIARELGDRRGERIALTNLGVLYTLLEQHGQAVEFDQQALDLARALGDREGEGAALMNVGVRYYYQEQYGKSEEWHQQALAIWREIGDRASEQRVLNNLMVLHMYQMEYPQALEVAQQALTLAQELGYRRGQEFVLRNLGALYLRLEQPAQALAFAKQALEIAQMLGEQDDVMRSSFVALNALLDLGQETAALQYAKTAVSSLEALRGGFQDAALKIDFLENMHVAYQALVSLLLRRHEAEPTHGYVDEAFHYAERGTARAFLDQLAEAGVGIRKGIDPALLEQERSMYNQLAEARQRRRIAQSENERTAAHTQVLELERRFILLQQTLRTQYPQYADLRYPEPATLAELQTTHLQDGEVLLKYFWGRHALHLFVVDRTHSHALTLPVHEQELTESLTQFLTPLHPRRSGSAITLVTQLQQLDLGSAHTLYKLLIEPATPYLKDIKTLVIVPDGILHYLPFELLLTYPFAHPSEPRDIFAAYHNAPYLVRRYAIVYAPSASVLRTKFMYPTPHHLLPPKAFLALAPFGVEGAGSVPPQNTQDLPKNLLTWVKEYAGFPSATEETARTFLNEPLPASRHEVLDISQMFYPDATVLLLQDATAHALRTQAKDYRYVHLATHGFVDAEHPMYSGVILQDAVLQTHELFNLDLQADLVTLSACETGLGALRQGEGLVGLIRAFMYAGTPSVLASLWRVNDTSTAELMKAFYRYLRAGVPKGEALQQAKLAIMQQYSHPYFWAPFVLVGAWR
jgi:CHAT domain-containing protein